MSPNIFTTHSFEFCIITVRVCPLLDLSSERGMLYEYSKKGVDRFDDGSFCERR